MSIFKKIPAIMSEVGAIEKNRKGDNINYRFRGIDDFYSTLQPLLSKHGVFCAPNVTAQHREERTTKSGGILTFTILTVEFTFYADDGSSFKLATIGEAMDTSDKSSNKAMSAAMKYAFTQLFCVPTEEEKDTEYRDHEPVHIQKQENRPERDDVPPFAPPATKQAKSQPEASSDVSKTICPFGKNKGLTFAQVGKPQLAQDRTYWIAKLREKDEDAKGQLKTFLEAINVYLAQ